MGSGVAVRLSGPVLGLGLGLAVLVALYWCPGLRVVVIGAGAAQFPDVLVLAVVTPSLV